MNRCRVIQACVLSMALLLLVAGPRTASSADYPNRPISILVPFAPGGAVDLVARIAADFLQTRWRQPVAVVNKPGGNTVPAVNELIGSKPDGYTILADNPPASSMLDIVVKALPFDINERTTLGIVTQTPMFIIVADQSNYRSLADAVSEAKRAPAEISWTSLGGAGAQDATFRLLFKAINVDVGQTKVVRLKGGAEAVTMVAGNHVKIGVGAWGAVAPLAASKSIRILAVTGPNRFPSAPDVPTTAELGFPTVQVLSWQGFSGPKGLPKEVIDAWDAALRDFVQSPQAQERLRATGVALFPKNGNEMKAYISQERSIMRSIFSE